MDSGHGGCDSVIAPRLTPAPEGGPERPEFAPSSSWLAFAQAGPPSVLPLQVISELNGKNIEDVIAQGIGKLASVPAGGAVAVSAAAGSAAPAAGAAPAAAEEKKDEKKEESEESDDDMGFGLFD
ncbi:PREDICTED: 60S acidic ribosomal protein P2 [Condylura cristata]|uniref:60S acidic ribosomal protein P2 n=1 Tax=Condylura cristata TaxID=143302 RepID=UPI0006437077|nr:PREDICTED: 60S acidic ribosomal protein P2 [Condylura cristata]